MKVGYVFAGQAAQFVGMGKYLADTDIRSKDMIGQADEILGYALSNIMFDGPNELLTQTIHTQPAVFLHSVLVYKHNFKGEMPFAVAGHSLGELSALVCAGVLSFEDGLRLVQKRAEAMQEACDTSPGTMAAILGMEDDIVETICASINEIVVPANYNCPGQLVISGSKEGIEEAVKLCSEQGAKRAMEINVGGAFHSPLMEPARVKFQDAVNSVSFADAMIPVYQNVDASAHTSAAEIKENILAQVTSPVKWTQCINQMIEDGAEEFVEVGGKGRILMGMIRKISRDINTQVWTENG